MQFSFELYRATSKSKDVPRKQKLIISSNDRMDFHQKANLVDALKSLAAKQVLANVDGEIVETSKFIQRKVGRKGARHTETVKSVAYKLAVPLFNEVECCSVTMTVFTPTNRKSDPDNLQPTLKALMDGFTDAGLWTDDNHEVVKFTKYQYGGLSGSKAYRLVLDIEMEKK